MRTDRLTRRYGLAVRWTHFPLHPETPPGGRALTELFAGRESLLAAMQEELRIRMAEEGLPYDHRRSRTYNSRLAQELGSWAQTRPGGGVLHDALFRAYFADGEDISDTGVLLRIVAEQGLPSDEARRVLAERSFRERVDRDWERSRALGVTGVPTYVLAGRALIGAQPYEALERLALAGGSRSS